MADGAKLMDGDTYWRGVNMRLHPSQLPAGIAAEAINKRFRAGTPETRLGFLKLGWCNKITAAGVQPFGAVYGQGDFSDPVTGREYSLIAADGLVYLTTANNTPRVLTLPDGVTITAAVFFVQCFDVVVMLRGLDLDPLVMTSVAEGFKAIEQTEFAVTAVDVATDRLTAPGHGLTKATTVDEVPRITFGNDGGTLPTPILDGEIYYIFVIDENTISVHTTATGGLDGTTALLDLTADGTGSTVLQKERGILPIPQGAFAVAAANRLFVLHGDYVAASDILDYTRYTIYDDFRINQGTADKLVAAAMFGPSTMVALKGRGVYRITGVGGDLKGLSLSGVTRRYGCVAAKSVMDVGKDLFWLSQNGVASLTLTAQNEIQSGLSQDLPMLSDAIQPLIDRINWNHAAGAVAAVWDNKYYLAVPLDDAESFRDELVPQGLLIWVTPRLTVTAGKTYRYVQGTSDTSLTNGTQVLTRSGDFVAQGSYVDLAVTYGVAVNASVRQVFKGINNAVLVYDLLNMEWSGHDEAQGLEVAAFFLATYNGRQRLFFVSPDGWVNLYEEANDDQLSDPYAELLLTGAPLPSDDTFRVNGGTVVAVDGATGNTDSALGAGGTLALTRLNLWTDSAGESGFYANALTPWSAPNTRVVPVANGVRFYGTNGLLPSVVVANVSGNWVVTERTTQPIVSTFKTRGYSMQAPASLKRTRDLELTVETWNPLMSIWQIADGVGEETLVREDWERSRTKYDRPHNRTRWNPTNGNDDHGEPYRQDYSVALGTGESITLGSGVKLNRHQDAKIAIRTGQLTRTAQIKIVCSQGRVRVLVARVVGNTEREGKKGTLV